MENLCYSSEALLSAVVDPCWKTAWLHLTHVCTSLLPLVGMPSPTCEVDPVVSHLPWSVLEVFVINNWYLILISLQNFWSYYFVKALSWRATGFHELLLARKIQNPHKLISLSFFFNIILFVNLVFTVAYDVQCNLFLWLFILPSMQLTAPQQAPHQHIQVTSSHWGLQEIAPEMTFPYLYLTHKKKSLRANCIPRKTKSKVKSNLKWQENTSKSYGVTCTDQNRH